MMGEMRRIVVFASALALFGSMVFAMEEDAMDKEMMMETPAPSVTVGGSGKIGIKNVDDSSKPNAEQFKLVRAYKVTFDSTGTTDGVLMFGAGMSIRDDTGEEDMPVVKGSYVFVGGGDGSWKLQFGGNDPGIDLAGGFGVADDHFGGEDDVSMAFSGSFGDTKFRITAADPGITVPAAPRRFEPDNEAARDEYVAAVDAWAAVADTDNDWSIGVSHSVNTINVGVGMDSEDGLAIGVGTDLSDVSTFLYWSKSEMKDVVFAYGFSLQGTNDVIVSQENTGLGVKASMSAGEGASFSIGYSTHKLEQKTTTANSIRGNGTAKTKLIEVDFSYDLGGGAIFSAGIDKKDEEYLTPASNHLFPSANANVAAKVDTKDITTLEAAISFSF